MGEKYRENLQTKINEDRFRRMADNIHEGLTIIENGKIVYLNEQACKIFGYPMEELMKLTSFDVAAPEERERLKNIQLKVESSGIKLEELSFWIIQKDGTRRYIKNSYSIGRKFGKISDIYVITTDITEQFLAEKKLKKSQVNLKESEEKYRMLFESANDAIMLMDKEQFIDCNQKTLKLLGLESREEFIGKTPWDFSPSNQSDKMNSKRIALEYIKKALEGHPQQFNWLISSSNRLIYVEVTLNRVILNNQIILQAVVRDFTEKRRIQKELEENENFLRDIFNGIQDGLCVLDLDHNLIKVNSTIKKMHDSKISFVGEKCYSIFQGRSKVCPWCPAEKTKQTGESFTEIVPYTKDGNREGWLELTTFPILDNNGRLKNIIEHVKDITKRMNTQLKLEESEKNYREAYNRLEFFKDLFTHDINNILQSILSANDLNKVYLENKLMNNLNETCRIIRNEIERGSRLVSNIRKLSMLEDEIVNKIEMDIINELNNSIEALNYDFSNTEINIRKNYSKNSIPMIGTTYLRDLFEIILTNSVIHNNEKIRDIEIIVDIVNKKDQSYIRFQFKDNGIGIKNSRKKVIFERERIQKKVVRGIGLGLALAKTIIDTIDGKIWVEDRVEGDYSKGSNFIILIPYIL